MSNYTNIHYLKEMTWQEVDSFDRDRTVVMVTAGPIEQHGPHIPLGTDLYIAEYVAGKCAEYLSEHQYQVLIAPTIPYVNALFSLHYPGSVSVRRKIVEEYVYDVLGSFAVNKFKHLVLVSQHLDPPWVGAAESACARVNEEYQVRAVSGFELIVLETLAGTAEIDLSHVNLEGDTHAGVYETAPMMYIQEQLVRKEFLQKLPPMPIEFSEMKEVRSFRDLGNGLGYTGDVSQVTKDLGEHITEYYAKRFKELILQHVQGVDVYSQLECSHLLG